MNARHGRCRVGAVRARCSRRGARPCASEVAENRGMTTYEISLRSPDPQDTGVRRIRVSASYIDNEQALSPEQKAAIRALAPGEVWTGRAIQVQRLDEGEAG